MVDRKKVRIAGSLLETMLDRNKQVSFPVGRVEYMVLRPCTFDEFIGAMGETSLCQMVRNADVPELLHPKVMNLFNRFSLVGGMPEAVARYTLYSVPYYYAGNIDKFLENIRNKQN